MSDTDIKTDPEATNAVPVVAEDSRSASDAKDAPKSSTAKKPKGFVEGVLAFLSSFGLTCLILLGLMVITYFGTYAQKSIGLVKAQQVYFDSFFCKLNFEAFGYPNLSIRFFGAFFLLIALSVNLIIGGIVRIKWRKRNTGILIGHFGIIFMLIAGLVKFSQSTNGHLMLDPRAPSLDNPQPQRVSNIYTSFHEWEIAIGEQLGDGKVREYLIPDSDLQRHGSFHSKDIPFRLVVDEYFENSTPRMAQNSNAAYVVDGMMLDGKEWDDQAPMNIAGAYVTVLVEGEHPKRGLVWGAHRHPWTIVVKGAPWSIDLRKRIFDLPFDLRLEKFTKEEYPGVNTPRVFASDVTKIEDGLEQKFHIAMNEPMRSGGYMFSQNNWGPQDGRPGPYYTVLEVSSNPSDQWPKYACYVIAIGLLIHFLTKLFKHVGKQNKLRAQAAATHGGTA